MRTEGNSNRISENPPMSEVTGNMVLVKTRRQLETLALPRTPRDTKETARKRAAKECHLSDRQATRILAGDLADVKGSVLMNVLFRFVAYQEEISIRAAAALNDSQAIIDAWEKGSGYDGTANSGSGVGCGEGRNGVGNRRSD